MSFLFNNATPQAASSSSQRAEYMRNLATLTSLPAGMPRSSKGARKRLARDGKVVAKFFNPVAGRPYPTNGISLEQQITVELTTSFTNFLVSTTSVPTYATSAFVLTTFGNSGEYTGLFDQYMFHQIEVWLEPTNPAGASNSVAGELTTCVDLDDASTPTSLAQIQGKQGAMIGDGAAGRYHRWVPHVAISAYSGTFTSFSNSEPCWIDAASPSVQHYGFKAGITATGVVQNYNLAVRAVVSFRAPGI
jgi:hypothetical protein